MAEGTIQVVGQATPTIVESMTRGEIDVQIATAHQFPRNLKRSVDEAKSLATVTAEIAEGMGYALPRAGKVIRGPSVRLAEVIGYTWGNLRYGARVVDIDGKFVTAQGVCHDLEKNVAATAEVKRRITDKAGRRYKDDMITVASNAACSIALRNAIFKVIPFALVQEVYDSAMRVAVGDMQSLAERRQRAMAYFTGVIGVEESRVLAMLGRKSVEEITLDDLATLTGIKTAIKDGEVSIETAFPQPGSRNFAAPAKQPEPHQPAPEIQTEEPEEEATQEPEPADSEPEVPAPTLESRRRRTRVVVDGQEIATAGISGETLQAIREEVEANPMGQPIMSDFLNWLPIRHHDLTYLREAEGRKLLQLLEDVAGEVAETEPPPDDAQACRIEPNMIVQSREGVRPVLDRGVVVSVDGRTCEVATPSGEIARWLVDDLEERQAQGGETEETPAEQPDTAAGWVLCKGPHVGKRVNAVAVCGRCPERGDCAELAAHRRAAAETLI